MAKKRIVAWVLLPIVVCAVMALGEAWFLKDVLRQEVQGVISLPATEEFVTVSAPAAEETEESYEEEWDEYEAYDEYEEAEEEAEPEDTGETGRDGRLTFDRLEPGLFLVMSEPYRIGKTTYYLSTSLVCVPGLTSDDTWEYDTVINPKGSSEKDPEKPKTELLAMEKETMGIYISGHPMDDYRQYLKNTHVVKMADLMDEEKHFQDDQIVSVAGIVQSVKMKTTRSNSMMAYVTVEDDTAAIEMLAFSNVLNQYGGYLRENSPVVITGRLSLRDDKEPQIVVNRARPMSDFAEANPEPETVQKPQPRTGTLYLRLPSEQDRIYPKIKAILNMFPGENGVVLYFSDTKQRRGTRCMLAESMLQELKNVLGSENVVLK